MEKATNGISTLGSPHVTAEFTSNFWSELLGYPNMFTLSIKTKNNNNNNMETGIFVWFYQGAFTGTCKVNLHSANRYTVNCFFQSKRNTAKYPKHFCKDCN